MDSHFRQKSRFYYERSRYNVVGDRDFIMNVWNIMKGRDFIADGQDILSLVEIFRMARRGLIMKAWDFHDDV